MLDRRIILTLQFLTIFSLSKAQDLYWELPWLPVTISYGENGFDVSGRAELVTPLGKFGVTESLYSNKDKIKNEDLLLIIRDVKLPIKEQDQAFKIKNGANHKIILTGTAKIEISKNVVILDVTDATIAFIDFKIKRGKEYSPEFYSTKEFVQGYYGALSNKDYSALRRYYSVSIKQFFNRKDTNFDVILPEIEAYNSKWKHRLYFIDWNSLKSRSISDDIQNITFNMKYHIKRNSNENYRNYDLALTMLLKNGRIIKIDELKR